MINKVNPGQKNAQKVYICHDKYSNEVKGLNQSINFWKQIVVAIIFEIVTVILKDVAVMKSDIF